jgi:hypothetical protein
MAKTRKKSFAEDLDTVGNRRVATAIIEGRQPVDAPPPKSHGKKSREKITEILPVKNSQDKLTGKTHGENTQDNITDILPVNNTQEKPTGERLRIKTRENRSRRIELNVTPSAYDRLKAEAAEAGESINETINQIIDIYFTDNE